MVPALAPTDHVGLMLTGLPAASAPTAVNCCVEPTETVAGCGLTVMVASGPATTVTDANPLTGPAAARTVSV